MNPYLEALIGRCSNELYKMQLIAVYMSAEQEVCGDSRLPAENRLLENLLYHENPELRQAARGQLMLETGSYFLQKKEAGGYLLQCHSDFPYCTLLYLQSILEQIHSGDQKPGPLVLQLAKGTEEPTRILNHLKLFSKLYPDISIQIPDCGRNPAGTFPEDKLFPRDPEAQRIFRRLLEQAYQEVMENPRLYQGCFGTHLSVPEWNSKEEKAKLETVVKLGMYGISLVGGPLVNADFASQIPCCDMLALYLYSRQQQGPRQYLIDAGPGEDVRSLTAAADALHQCDPSFQCSIPSY